MSTLVRSFCYFCQISVNSPLSTTWPCERRRLLSIITVHGVIQNTCHSYELGQRANLDYKKYQFVNGATVKAVVECAPAINRRITLTKKSSFRTDGNLERILLRTCANISTDQTDSPFRGSSATWTGWAEWYWHNTNFATSGKPAPCDPLTPFPSQTPHMA